MFNLSSRELPRRRHEDKGSDSSLALGDTQQQDLQQTEKQIRKCKSVNIGYIQSFYKFNVLNL